MQSILEALFAGILKSGQKGFLSGGFVSSHLPAISERCSEIQAIAAAAVCSGWPAISNSSHFGQNSCSPLR